MKTIAKTFYVSDECFERIKNNSIGFSTNESDVFKNQIQISWQEPEAKYNLTIDEIFDLWADWYHKSGVPAHFKDHLRKKLFGASNGK